MFYNLVVVLFYLYPYILSTFPDITHSFFLSLKVNNNHFEKNNKQYQTELPVEVHNGWHHCEGPDRHREVKVTLIDSRRRKKTVRFDGPQTKDSGIDTSSTFTSSEDSNSTPKVYRMSSSPMFIMPNLVTKLTKENMT